MEVDKIIDLFLDKCFDIDETYLREYIDFCYSNVYVGDEYSEKHHILMRTHFPEYEREDWNIVRLKISDHVEAHSLLAKGLPSDKKANYAHFLMRALTNTLSEEQRRQNAERMIGENNPAKRADVRKKITESKQGKSRPDMIGTRYFGASEETIDRVRKNSSEVHMGTVPVRLPDGSVIKVKTDDPRYLSGELKCIIGAKKGDVGPLCNPEAKAKYHKTLEERRNKFASMSGEDIAAYCLEMESVGKVVFKNGKLTNNYARLFKYANLNPNDFIENRQGSTTIENTASNLVEDWCQ